MRRHVLVVLLAVALAAGCGARLNEEQRAALAGSDGGSSGGGVVVTTAPTGNDLSGTSTTIAGDDASGPTTTAATGGASGPTTTAAPGTNGGGGGGDAGGPIVVAPPAAGSGCGGGGASDVGITETEIKIGNISTISGPIPGFGQTSVNATKAYVNFLNSQGGLCGRQVTLVTADDRLQSGTNKSETDKMIGEVFSLVGNLTVVDDGGAQSLAGTNIADVALSLSEARIKLENNYSPTPIDLASGGNAAEQPLKYMKENLGVTKGGIIWPAQASAKARAQGYIVDMERAGIEVVFTQEVAVTETNYADDAAAVENAGVEVLMTTLEVSGMARLAKALDQNGYFPPAPFYGAQAYGRLFLNQAGSAAEPTVLGLAYSIFEDRGAVKSVDDFLTWYELTNPGADIDFFAIEAWVSADLWATGMRGIQGEPTRDKLIASLETQTAYDAGGFKAPFNPAQKKGPTCFMIAEVEGGQWKRSHPASGFDCSYA